MLPSDRCHFIIWKRLQDTSCPQEVSLNPRLRSKSRQQSVRAWILQYFCSIEALAMEGDDIG